MYDVAVFLRKGKNRKQTSVNNAILDLKQTDHARLRPHQPQQQSQEQTHVTCLRGLDWKMRTEALGRWLF